MKKQLTIGLCIFTVVLVLGNISSAVLSEDFEDGDYTNNPTWWVYTDAGAELITDDPVRPDNLVWKAYGTGSGHRRLRTNVSGVSWDNFDISLDYMASASGYFHGACFLVNEGGTSRVALWYDTGHNPDVYLYILQEYGTGFFDFTSSYISIGNVPRDQWLKLHSWYDTDANLIRAEARVLETDALIGHVSSQPVMDISQMGDIDMLSIGIEETEWQYMDNVLLTPEPTTIILLGLGGFVFLKKYR